MKQKPHKVLEKIGLTKSEAKIYIASLFLGPSTVIKIGQKAKLTRQMVYTMMPRLLEFGLIKEKTIGEKKCYEATNPDNLKEILKEITREINDLIPELKSRQATSSIIPLVTVYENPLSMRDWYKEFMKKAKKDDEVLVWSCGSSWINLDPDFYQKYLDFKCRIGIDGKTIAPDTSEGRSLYKKLGFKNGVYRFVKDWWQKDAEMWIWRDEICYLVIRENATSMIVVKSADLAAIECFNFYQIWDKLKE